MMCRQSMTCNKPQNKFNVLGGDLTTVRLGSVSFAGHTLARPSRAFSLFEGNITFQITGRPPCILERGLVGRDFLHG